MSDATEPRVVTVTTYEGARDAFRQKQLRQALYDAGDVVMADVLVNLHGDEHRARRRLENRLFRRDTQQRYERSLFPPIVAETLAPHVAAGRAELVSLSHQLMMNLAASTAGVDRPARTAEETARLYSYLMRFIEGATLAHYTGDRAAKRAEVAAALSAFDDEFLVPSIARRRAALAAVAAGELDEDELPRDVLTVLLRNEDDLDLGPDVVLRETCFYLLAGAHTSATAFVRTLDRVFELDRRAPAEAERARHDLAFLQRCVHETIRLQPSSPVAMRWALEPIELQGGEVVAAGDKVVIDLMAANRDPSAYGPDADAFDPHRALAPGVAPWGLSFGLGMHACIGQELAAGSDVVGAGEEVERLVGLVPVAARTPTTRPGSTPRRPGATGRPTRCCSDGGRPRPRRRRLGAAGTAPPARGAAMIDLHAHVVLESVLGAAGPHGPELDEGDPSTGRLPCFRVGDYELVGVRYRGSPFMDLDARLAAMDAAGIGLQVLSPNPLTYFAHVEPDWAAAFCRRHNDELAALVSRAPTRLGGFAQLPMQDPARAADELRRSVGELGLLGAYLGTDLGRPLDDPCFDVVWAAAVELDVPVLLHPAPDGIGRPRRDERLARFDGDLWLGFLYEETLAVSTLVLGGVLDRHPSLDVCVSHGGGATSWLAERMEHAARTRPWGSEALAPPGAVAERLGRLWWDAHVGGPRALAALVAALGTDRIVAGTNLAGWDQSLDPSHGDAALASTFDANARRLLRLGRPEGP